MKTHQKNIKKRQEIRKINKNHLKEQMNVQAEYNNKNLYDVMYMVFDKLKVSNFDSLNDYYQPLFAKYKTDGMKFKINQFYGFNKLAFFFGFIWYIYNGLYLGFFLNILIALVTINFLNGIAYLLFQATGFDLMIPTILIIHIVGALLANYCLIIKNQKYIEKGLRKHKTQEKLIDYVLNKNTGLQYFNFMKSIPYFIVLFALFSVYTFPQIITEPEQAMRNINILFQIFWLKAQMGLI